MTRNIAVTAVVRLAATVVARAMGSATMTAGYHGNGGGGNEDEDEDDNKGNKGKNRESDGNNRGGASYLCLIFFFLVGLTTHSRVFFCSIHNCHVMTQTTVCQ